MDGAEGERHPEWAACKTFQWFGPMQPLRYLPEEEIINLNYLCWAHSQVNANRFKDKKLSKLGYADKLGTVMMPWWLWAGLGMLTGEIWEYVSANKHVNEHGGNEKGLKDYFLNYRKWVHKKIKENEVEIRKFRLEEVNK